MSVVPKLSILLLLNALFVQIVSGYHSDEYIDASEDPELGDNILKSQSQESDFETHHFGSSLGESGSFEEFLNPTFSSGYKNTTMSSAGCKRHKWIPMHSMKPQDVLNLHHFHYNGADKLPLFPCRVKTKSGMRVGMYNQLKQECVITNGVNEKRVKSDVEVLTIPGGLNLQTGIYKVESIACNKMLKTAVVAYNPSGNRIPYIGYMRSPNGVGAIGEAFGQHDKLSVGSFVVRGKSTQVKNFSVLTCVQCAVFATTPRTTTTRPTKRTKLPTRHPITTVPPKKKTTIKPSTKPKPTGNKKPTTKHMSCFQTVKVKTTCSDERCKTIVVEIELHLDRKNGKTDKKSKKNRKKKFERSNDEDDDSGTNKSLFQPDLVESTLENSAEETFEHVKGSEGNSFESDDGRHNLENSEENNSESREGNDVESMESDEVNESGHEADSSLQQEYEVTSGSIENESDSGEKQESEEYKDIKAYKTKKGTCITDFKGKLTLLASEAEDDEGTSGENYQVGDVVESYEMGTVQETVEVSDEVSNESGSHIEDVDSTTISSRGTEFSEEEKSSESNAQHSLEYHKSNEQSQSHEDENKSDGHNDSNDSTENLDSDE